MGKDIRKSHAKPPKAEYKHIRRLENKTLRHIKTSVLAKIAKAFNISLSEFSDMKE